MLRKILKYISKKIKQHKCGFKDPICLAKPRMFGCICGKTKAPAAPAPPPTPPSAKETSAQAIQAQIDAQPKILAAQKEFGPQFAETQLAQQQEFAPQYLQSALELSQQFGPEFAEQVLAEQDVLDPSRSAGSRAVAEFLERGPEELSPEDQRALEQSVRGAGAARGLSKSGFNAQEEISRIFGARQALNSRFLNVALSASGRLPAAQGGSTVNTSGGQVGQIVQGVSPTAFLGAQAANNQFASSIFSTQGSIFANQNNNATARRSQNIGLGSDIFGGIAGFGGSYAQAGGFGLPGIGGG